MKIKIDRVNIRNFKEVEYFKSMIDKYNPEIVAFDTETNGLNIMYNRPFLYSFGFIITKEHFKTFTLDLENYKHLIKETFKHLFYMFQQAKIILGHNITFDMHMSRNINYPIPEELYPKIQDTMFYIRLGEDPIPPKEGGVPLGLKDYVYRYIWKGAKLLESKLKIEQKQKRVENTSELLKALREKPLIEKYRESGKEKRWTKAMVDNFTKDILTYVEELPEDIQPIIRRWKKKEKDIDNYQLLNRDNVEYYAHYDIVLTFLVYLANKDRIVERDLSDILQEEIDALPQIYDMEKAGKYFDYNYAIESRNAIKNYILKLRGQLKELLQADIKANQSVKIKELLNEKYDLNLESTDKEHLAEIEHEEASKIGNIITHLRTYIKWYSTYFDTWIQEAEEFGKEKIYPTYNQVGTVTGRASSPFQTFPKKGLKDLDGNLICHPRKMLTCPENYTLVYFDYAAMEMRMLANMSILLNSKDKNICRLFIPYECEERDGKFYFKEDPDTEWKEQPPHDMTTQNTFHLKPEDPTYQEHRAICKSANFAIIYGASGFRVAVTLKLPLEMGNKLHDGFYNTFRTMYDYDNYIKSSIYNHNYVPNLFGRKYHNINAHKGKNYVIQGSCADYTKKLLPEVRELIKSTKSEMENYLHDEFSFRIHNSEKYLVPKIKKIMEQLEVTIPMLVDVEISKTNWSEKIDINKLDQEVRHDFNLP